MTNTYFCKIVPGSCFCCLLLWLFKFVIAKCFVKVAGVQLGRTERPFFENRQEGPDFGKKSPDCFHLWVQFSIQNVVLRVSRRKISKIFPGGTFFLAFFTRCLSKCPNSRNLPCPEKFLVAPLNCALLH